MAKIIKALVVAGGGGGGGSHAGGGGGGGGVIYNSAYSLSNGTYTITVGTGGAGAPDTGRGGAGNNSIFGSLTAIGGGGGAFGDSNNADKIALEGGSGGGGSGYSGISVGKAGTNGQGYAGGNGSGNGANYGQGGGGGGASQAGQNASGILGNAGGYGGKGGDGYTCSITGSSVVYGGGGGGGGWNSAPRGLGGTGGGGNGATVGAGSAGTAHTGGGGGGSGATGTRTGGAGGSGIVILRLTTQEFDTINITGATNTKTTIGGDTLLTFNETGTLEVVEVIPSDPVINTEVSATGVNLFDTVSESTLSGTFKDVNTGVAVAGVLSWTNPTKEANSSPINSWTFTPTNNYKYHTIYGYVAIAITDPNPTQKIKVRVDEVEITDQILYPSLTIRQQLSNTVDTANFSVKKYGLKTFTPTINSTVKIYDGVSKIFSGKLLSYNHSTESLPNEKIYDISCVDNTYELDSILVSRSYENTTIRDIITDIIADFAPAGSGFSANNVESTFLITKIVFNQIPISQCLRRLADIVKYEWYIDEEKDINFFPKFSKTSPFNMTDGLYVIKSYQRGVDGSQIVNRIKVRGALYDGSTFTDKITVKGSVSKSFKLPYLFSNLTIKVNTVSKTVGIDFIDDFTTKQVLYNYQDQSFHFENPLADGDVIEYSGNPKVPVLAISEDSASIALYGKKEKLIKDTTITSNETARKRATAELYVYANSIIDASFSTYQAGLRAGQVIITPDGDSMLIKAVSFVSYTPLEFKYNISLISTQRYDLIDLLRKIITPVEEPIDDNEVAEQLYNVNEQVSITEEIEFIAPYATEDTIEIQADERLNAVAPANIEWVYAPYTQTSITDVKRSAIYDNGAVYM